MPRRRLVIYVLLILLIGFGYYFPFPNSSTPPSEESGSSAEKGEISRIEDSIKSSGAPSVQAGAKFNPQLATQYKRQATYSMKLIVVDDSSAVPVENAKVLVYESTPENRNTDELNSAHTDTSGEVTFDLSAGQYVVAVEHDRYLRTRIQLDYDGSNSILRRLPLHPVVLVTGVVQDRTASSVGGVDVSFSDSRGSTPAGRTEPDGTFRARLASGRYTVVARQDPWPHTALFDVEFWPGPEFFLELRFDLPRGGPLFEGQVVGEDGPVSGALVSLETGTQGQLESLATEKEPIGTPMVRVSPLPGVRSDQKGRFQLPLPSHAEVELRIRAEGFEDFSRQIGQVPGALSTFRLQRARLFVVRVVDRQGTPIPTAKIRGLSELGRPVMTRHSVLRYSAQEYPFRIFAQDRRSGIPITAERWITEYRPEVVLLSEQ